jgi:hypothetical protein
MYVQLCKAAAFVRRAVQSTNGSIALGGEEPDQRNKHRADCTEHARSVVDEAQKALYA